MVFQRQLGTSSGGWRINLPCRRHTGGNKPAPLAPRTRRDKSRNKKKKAGCRRYGRRRALARLHSRDPTMSCWPSVSPADGEGGIGQGASTRSLLPSTWRHTEVCRLAGMNDSYRSWRSKKARPPSARRPATGMMAVFRP